MRKRKADDDEEVEEHKNKYMINTDLIETLLKDQDEIQDINSMRAQALAHLNKDLKKPALLPNQAMASVAELKKELQKAKGNQNLQLSILETLISKTQNDEKLSYLLSKVEILLEQSRLNEAENDVKSLISLQPSSKHRLLYSRILNRKKDPLFSMAQLLRCSIPYEHISVSELYNSLISQLALTPFYSTLAVTGSNINYTIGNGTQDSSHKLKFLPELKGRIVMQACCGEFHTLILACSCMHLPKQEICPNELEGCCGGFDVIGWGENSHGQVLGSMELDIVKKPLACEFLIGQNVNFISTYRYLSAAACKNGVKVWGDINGTLPIQAQKLACGANFILISTENEVFVCGDYSYEGVPVMTDLNKIGDLKVKDMNAGLAHAVLIDTDGNVHVFGYGEKGELGLGPNNTHCSIITPNSLSNCSKVLCHGQVSVAIQGSTVYVWGLVNPESLEGANSIEWEPMALTLPFQVLSAGIGKHEVFAFCADSKIYVWELNFSRRFKKSQEDYKAVNNVREIALGRSMQIFVQGVLIPQRTQLLSCPSAAQSGEVFQVELQLSDQFGPVSLADAPISIMFSPTDQKPSQSSIPFTLFSTQASPTILHIAPQGFGTFFLHIFIAGSLLPNAPKLSIAPSEDDLALSQSLESARQQEALKDKERQEKQQKLEMEKKKSQQQAEELNKKKKEETDKRASDALKSHRAKQDKEKEDKERERKQKLEFKTGGGYDLNKKKKK